MQMVVSAVAALAASALVASTADTVRQPPPAYTFHMNVDMAMRTFPWMHFRMEGAGEYQRGERYIVHLTKKPGFAAKMHDIDLSMIDRSMWPSRYQYREVGTKDGDTLYALKGIKNQSDLTTATVALGESGAHWVDAVYGDGMHVHMTIASGDVSGYQLPTSLNASVDYPHMFPMAADASFSDYSFMDSLPSPPAAPLGQPSPPAE